MNKQRMIREKLDGRTRIHFWGGIILFGIGVKLVTGVGIWSDVCGIVGLILGLRMLVTVCLRKLQDTDSFLEYLSLLLATLFFLVIALSVGLAPHASFFEYLFALIETLLFLAVATSSIASILDLGPSLSTLIAMFGAVAGTTSFFLSTGVDFLDNLDEALQGPLGWFFLGWFFLRQGNDAGGVWTVLGPILAVICWLIGLVWKFVKSALQASVQGQQATSPAFSPSSHGALELLRKRIRHPLLALVALLSGGTLLVHWLMVMSIIAMPNEEPYRSLVIWFFWISIIGSTCSCIVALIIAEGWGWRFLILFLNFITSYSAFQVDDILFPVLGTLSFAFFGPRVGQWRRSPLPFDRWLPPILNRILVGFSVLLLAMGFIVTIIAPIKGVRHL